MALRNAKSLLFRPTGLSDSQDGTNASSGAMQKLVNLVPNPATDKTFVPRPASQPLIEFVANSELWVVGASCEVLQFPLTADGNVAATIDIQGNLTQLTSALPNGDDNSFTFAVDVDSVGNQYVAGYKLISGGTGIQYFYTVYASGANGNVAPIHYVHGSNTGFDALVAGAGNAGICVDPSGNIYVALFTQIYKFPAGSDGNAASTIFAAVAPGGSRAFTSLRYDPTRRLIWASAATSTSQLTDNALYAYDLTGVLQRTITDSNNFSAPVQVDIGPDGAIYVSDVFAFANVLVYSANAVGESLPIRTITLPPSGHNRALGVAVDSTGRVYTAGNDGVHSLVFVYETGATDPVNPIQAIGGNLTLFDKMLITSSPPNAATIVQQLRIH